MRKIDVGRAESIQVNCPPDNLKPHLNAVEIIVMVDGERRVRIINVEALDNLINDLIAARNAMWPYPKFEARP